MCGVCSQGRENTLRHQRLKDICMSSQGFLMLNRK